MNPLQRQPLHTNRYHLNKRPGTSKTGYSKFRMILVLFLFTNLQLLGNGYSQGITIVRQNTTIDEIFRTIHQQTGYDFIYNSEVVQPSKKISINVVNASINEVLSNCLKGLPVVYSIEGKTIMVREKSKMNISSGTYYEVPSVASIIKGKVLGADGKPLGYVSVQVQQSGITVLGRADGTFEIPVENLQEVTFTVTYVGKSPVTKTVKASEFDVFQTIILQDLSLKLKNVEVNAVRKRTLSSNSSFVFDREAIEQTQALSVGDVLRYLPGQSIVRSGVGLQGANIITLRDAAPPNSVQSLNNAFGISVQVDGNVMDNNSNMQTMNPNRMGFFSANNISTPNTLGDLSLKNGTLNNNYIGDVANNGVDLRNLQAENIESIEVISGVASAKYGDYNTGVVIINTQAGVTPLRASIRTNEGTQNIGLNKGVRINPKFGVVNFSLDYLNSNDDPRNKLKAYNRVGGGVIWTYNNKKKYFFRNTLNVSYNQTLDHTRRDPDDGNERMSRFSNWSLRMSDRAEIIFKKPWLYNMSAQASYNIGRQDSYSQYYLNTRPVMGVTNSEVTGTSEGIYVPGYYMAVQQIIGEPVSASGRLEANTFLKIKKISYKVTLGANFNYNANKGPGIIVFSDRPRFYQTGNKSDRARSFNNVPTQRNVGFYLENVITTKILERSFNLNAGLRGDIQHGFFNISPRINSNWRLSNKVNWSLSYGIATKAPSLSQISPGNVYVDIPLVNAYTGNADKSVYLVHTEVIKTENKNLKPYKSSTLETGFSVNIKPIHASLFLFQRTVANGFASLSQIIPIVLPNYTVTNVPNEKPLYSEDGTYKTYNVTYSRITNGNYNKSRGIELSLSFDKIEAIATSFNLSTAYYHSYYKNSNEQISTPSDAISIDYTKPAVYGVYRNQASVSENIKSTLTSSTHVPALRMAILVTGEFFWLNKTKNLATSAYPIGYMNKDLQFFPLDTKQAQLPEYAHLLKTASDQNLVYRPSFIYSNIHMRLSKEIGDNLRFAFNSYNIFNIRPVEDKNGSITYFNGRPSFGAELILTIK